MQLKTLGGFVLTEDYNPCSCCGMTYRAPAHEIAEIKTAGKGIRVIYGTHGRERERGTIKIKHVETKNGVLTVVNKVK